MAGSGNGASGLQRQVIEDLLDGLVEQQRLRVQDLGERLVPGITPEDLRNAHDFGELQSDADFQYQDGILAGLLSAQHALRAELGRRAATEP